jgi:SAM-dependent methyltransferase
MKCRHCHTALQHIFLDLGFAPPSNAYLTKADLNKPEIHYPLKVLVCDQCWLVQTEDFAQREDLFRADYAYFSSTSTSWLAHAEQYAEYIIDELKLSSQSHVLEIACNDGYLLKNFIAAGIPCTGVEPTKSTADAAERLGVPVVREFFGEMIGNRLANEGKQADLIIGNNVYAHVPDINDFTKGLKRILKPGGTITLEFPHLLQLIQHKQFDTVYHEHFSYLSLHSVNQIFSRAELRIFRVEELGTHGGSLRLFGCHAEDPRANDVSVKNLLVQESEYGLTKLETYSKFQLAVDEIKNEFIAFLIKQKKLGKKVVAYGAAAKGNTLLNYAGVKPDLLPVVYDAAAAKQGKFLPGSHIPILPPAALLQDLPDVIIILPWNIQGEVKRILGDMAEKGVDFLVAIPNLRSI